MIMSVWAGQLKPGQAEAAAEFTDKNFRTFLQQAKGFIKAYGGVDQTGTQSIAVFFWESEEDAAIIRNSPELREKFMNWFEFYVGSVSRTTYEVTSEWTHS